MKTTILTNRASGKVCFMKTKTAAIRSSINRSPLRYGLFLTLLALTSFALLPRAKAVVPAPDGGYPGWNTAEGTNALFKLTNGIYNTAIGGQALYSVTGGSNNTAVGLNALYHNNGSNNTATGFEALFSNTTGTRNTATGVNALFSNTTGTLNTASGDGALSTNTYGFQNTATGAGALSTNTGGTRNTATGVLALASNTTCSDNTAMGFLALLENIGCNNTAFGSGALKQNTYGFGNTAVGAGALDALLDANSANYNIAVGLSAGSSLVAGSNNIYIGNVGVEAESGSIRIGTSGNESQTQTKTFIAGIRGATVPTGIAVIVGSNGRLGTTTSSGRFKEAIQPMDKASEAILALKPVTFRYKHEFDPDGIPQFGLVAEEVEKVNRALVAYDDHGKPHTVRYEAVNAMLLNEFLKEHRKVQAQERKIREQEATIAELKKGLQSVVAHLKEHDSKIQQVNTRLKLQTAPASTVVSNQ
jgi:trimeric autotransporter adhesin